MNLKTLLHSWWVVLFVIGCFFCYEQGIKHVDAEFTKLYAQLETLKIQMNSELALQEDLQLQVGSQSDPAWIELALMRGLGLVPEGQIKVYFSGDP